MKWLGHLKTINHHKYLVMKYCFRAGLYWQGLTHDLSKYTPTEFMTGARYYTDGKASPNNAERLATGYSLAWLHHKGRNKHHLEYWIDYMPGAKTVLDPITGRAKPESIIGGNKMPLKYVVEMFCDRVAASKNYGKEHYHDGSALEYFNSSRDHYLLHPETSDLLEHLLLMLKEKGEEETFHYIRTELLPKKTY